MLTTYNGQKALLKDVFKARCANNPIYGMPAKITTVDKYQGQQNDCMKSNLSTIFAQLIECRFFQIVQMCCYLWCEQKVWDI